MNCACCDTGLTLRWTDTHGVGVCTECGLPYRVLFYDEHEKRIEKEPEPALTEGGLTLAKRYWKEEHARVFAGAHSFMRQSGTTYDGATEGECSAWHRWFNMVHAKGNEKPA